MLQRAVAYYRVSTQRQGRSGLGLGRRTLHGRRFAEAEGTPIRPEFTEVETGNNADALAPRPSPGLKHPLGA